jgi:hypothetical protein
MPIGYQKNQIRWFFTIVGHYNNDQSFFIIASVTFRQISVSNAKQQRQVLFFSATSAPSTS